MDMGHLHMRSEKKNSVRLGYNLGALITICYPQLKQTVSPENQWLEDCISFLGMAYFQG